ncbi:hypothetical protein [Nonomuraea sp. 10N515B]|uniref:hypothetical protein n=1 Tax=Nonomuraea sp. 10N515B TaxID=3457422 RepID=UPI003FCD4623
MTEAECALVQGIFAETGPALSSIASYEKYGHDQEGPGVEIVIENCLMKSWHHDGRNRTFPDIAPS